MAPITAHGQPTDPLANPSLSAWSGSAAAHLGTDTWTSWTPTLTGFTASSIDAKFRKTPGGLCTIDVHITVSAVSGHSSFTLPYAASKRQFGVCGLEDINGSVFLGVTIFASTLVYVQALGASNGIRAILSPTIPFTWAAGDLIHVSDSYQCAPAPVP